MFILMLHDYDHNLHRPLAAFDDHETALLEQYQYDRSLAKVPWPPEDDAKCGPPPVRHWVYEVEHVPGPLADWQGVVYNLPMKG